MKTYYASKNKNIRHKQDPDYFVFFPKTDKNAERKLAGKIYKNGSKAGNQYLKIIIFRDEENN